MKKSELTNGMHIITNNDEEFIVMSNVIADKQIEDGKTAHVILVRIDGHGWLKLDDYDENLNRIDSGDDDFMWDFEIKAIYKPLYYYDILSSVYDAYHRKNFVQIYGRRKMTKEQIENARGYEIEIVESED